MEYQESPVVVTRAGEHFTLKFNGPIHVNTAWLESELDKVVAAKPKVVDLDLSPTEYISSLGLGILVYFNKRIHENGGRTKIVKIRKQTLGVLRASRLDMVLHADATTEVIP